MSFSKQKIPFTQVANEVLQNPNISAKAKGIYAYLYSKPDNWNFAADRIKNEMKDGRDSIAAGLRELESAGVLRRIKKPDGKVLYQMLYKGLEEVKKPKPENPSLGGSQNRKIPKRENPTYGKSLSGKTRRISNKEFTQIKNNIIKKEREKERAPTFDEFFLEYGKPINEELAREEWDWYSDEEKIIAFGFIKFYKQYEAESKFRMDPKNYLQKKFWLSNSIGIFEMLEERKKDSLTYYDWNQVLNLVHNEYQLTTDHFEQVPHHKTGALMWVRKINKTG